MRQIAVINQKGGVGKTTTTCNVGAAIASTGRRVLLIDLDPQAHLTMHFGVEPDTDRPSIYDVLTDGRPIAETIMTLRDNLDLVPSHIDLAAAEMELVSVMGREVVLREALQANPTEYDFVMIDCPPSLGVLTINGLAAMREVFIPMQAHFLALQGMGKLLESIRLMNSRINPDLRVTGILFCMYEAGTRLAGEVAADLAEFLERSRGANLPWSDARQFNTVIRRNVKLAECPSHGLTIFDYAARSNGALDYAALTAEILGLEELTVPVYVETAESGAATPPETSASAASPQPDDSSSLAMSPYDAGDRTAYGPDDVALDDQSAPPAPGNSGEQQEPVTANADEDPVAAARPQNQQPDEPSRPRRAIISVDFEDDATDLSPLHEAHRG